MPKHSNSGNGNRSMWNAGKGSADRSPKWRDHYSEILWPDGGQRKLIDGDGFSQKGGRLVKRYGVAEPEKYNQGPHIKA